MSLARPFALWLYREWHLNRWLVAWLCSIVLTQSDSVERQIILKKGEGIFCGLCRGTALCWQTYGLISISPWAWHCSIQVCEGQHVIVLEVLKAFAQGRHQRFCRDHFGKLNGFG